jgi:hypothetical protein
VTSVDGETGMQCEPSSGSCTGPAMTCQDDSWEVNDSRSDASSNPTMTTGDYDLVSCPSATDDTRANDDWFKIVLTESSRTNINLVGDGAVDLDLHLYHSDGTVVTASTSNTADEAISECLPAATYYIKVNGYGYARSLYSLDYETSPETCNTTCVDDSNEPDDTFSQARDATFLPYSSTGDTICPNNDDWYHVTLYTGDTLGIALTFTQIDETQDLDLHFYDADGTTDEWPCSPADPTTCTAAHGQGAVSNEAAQFVTPSGCDAGCDYYVVVRGWAGATNSYGISLAVQ